MLHWKGLHPRVIHHVTSQVTRVYASIIALVTLEWLVSSMHHHHVLFHITSVNFRMLWEKVLLRVSFATFVALERLNELYEAISGKEKCASSCGDTGHQSVCKHNCTGYTWMAFLQYASSSYALSNH